MRTIMLLLFAISAPSTVLATAVGAVHPADSAGLLDSSFDLGGYVSINPNLDPVTGIEGYQHYDSIEVDASTGYIRGYAGYSLETSNNIEHIENTVAQAEGTGTLALVANSSGGIVYDSTVAGPTGGNHSATIFIDVTGSFNYLSGTPSLGLAGAVEVFVAPAGSTLDGLTYVLGGQFTNVDDQTFIPVRDSIFTTGSDDFVVVDSDGNLVPNPNLSGIVRSVEYIDMDPSNLSLRVSLSVPIQNGDQITIGAGASGLATHAFLEDFRDVEVGELGSVDAASGFVDFLHSASVGIVLPYGFSLTGVDAPPSSIVTFANPVPEPSYYAMFGTGLIVVCLRMKRDRRISSKKC